MDAVYFQATKRFLNIQESYNQPKNTTVNESELVFPEGLCNFRMQKKSWSPKGKDDHSLFECKAPRIAQLM